MDIVVTHDTSDARSMMEVEPDEPIGELKDRIAEVMGFAAEDTGDVGSGRLIRIRIESADAPELDDDDIEAELAGICDGDNIIVSLRSVKCPHEYVGHSGGAGKLEVAVNGSRLYTAGLDLALKVWDTENGKCVKSIPADFFKEILVSPCGRQLYTADMHLLLVWNTETWESKVIEEEPATSIALCPSGEKLYVSGAGLRVWETASWDFHEIVPSGKRRLSALAVSRCGSRVYACDGLQSEIVLYCAQTWKTLRTVALDFEPKQIAVSPCGEFIYSRSNRAGEVFKWESETLAEAGVFDCSLVLDMVRNDSNSGQMVWSIAVSGCGRWLYCAGYGVVVFDTRNAQCRGMHFAGEFCTSLATYGEYLFCNPGKKPKVVRAQEGLQAVMYMELEGDVEDDEEDRTRKSIFYNIFLTTGDTRVPCGRHEEFFSTEERYGITTYSRLHDTPDEAKKEGCCAVM